MAATRKLVLCVIDSLRAGSLAEAIAEDMAPTLATLLERGTYIPDCISSFPSVTPVCSADIATGCSPDRHGVPGMSWFHKGERRIVEYGSSLAASRAVGLLRSLYDTVYNMNLAHLSHRTPTLFERLDDAGLRTACTPFLIYRGRRRHHMNLEGMLRRVALAADFRHAVWGPGELFYGELYASRRVPCPPTLARPNTKDAYSGCVGEQLVAQDLFDFLLFSLPDNDYHSHRYGPDEQVSSIAHADDQLARLIAAGGGIDGFLAEHAIIVMADHSQSWVDSELDLAGVLGKEWSVLDAASQTIDEADLAVTPSARAAAIYVLHDDPRRARTHRSVRERLASLPGVELVAWLARDGGPLPAVPTRSDLDLAEAVVGNGEGELRFRPGSAVHDVHGVGWDVEGEVEVLEARLEDGLLVTPQHPDALGRLWAGLHVPEGGDILVSLEEGWECVDLGGSSHVPGGSHGSLRAGDSLAPLLLCGCGPQEAGEPGRWSLTEVAPIVLEHFGVG